MAGETERRMRESDVVVSVRVAKGAVFFLTVWRTPEG